MAIKQAKMLFITSVKGGTGKSVTTLNLAGIYARMNKSKTPTYPPKMWINTGCPPNIL